MDREQFILGKVDGTTLDASLIQAYRETNYGVGINEDPHGGFTLMVGSVSAHLLALHKRHGLDCSAYITPCNPLGKAHSPAANETHVTSMRAQLQKRSLRWQAGTGVHPDGQWDGEHSFLILGLSLEPAKSIGMEYRQNAIVWAGKDAVPKLVLLR